MKHFINLLQILQCHFQSNDMSKLVVTLTGGGEFNRAAFTEQLSQELNVPMEAIRIDHVATNDDGSHTVTVTAVETRQTTAAEFDESLLSSPPARIGSYDVSSVVVASGDNGNDGDNTPGDETIGAASLKPTILGLIAVFATILLSH